MITPFVRSRRSLLITAAAAVSCLFGLTWLLSTQFKSEPQPFPTQWKTHSDSALGLTVRYPTTWFDKGQQSVEGWGTWHDFASMDVESAVEVGSGVWIRIAHNKTINQEGFWKSQSVKDYFEYLKNAKIGEVRTGDQRYRVVKLRESTVDGYPAITQIEETAPEWGTEYEFGFSVYIFKNGNLFSVRGISPSKQAWESHRGEFDRIVQSLHFLE